jgi:hypothetical protein
MLTTAVILIARIHSLIILQTIKQLFKSERIRTMSGTMGVEVKVDRRQTIVLRRIKRSFEEVDLLNGYLPFDWAVKMNCQNEIQ